MLHNFLLDFSQISLSPCWLIKWWNCIIRTSLVTIISWVSSKSLLSSSSELLAALCKNNFTLRIPLRLLKLEVRVGCLLLKQVKMSSGTGGRLTTLFKSINESLDQFSGYFSSTSLFTLFTLHEWCKDGAFSAIFCLASKYLIFSCVFVAKVVSESESCSSVSHSSFSIICKSFSYSSLVLMVLYSEFAEA